VAGINTDIVDSLNRTALDTVREQKTHKAQEIARLVAGNFIHLTSSDVVIITVMIVIRF